MVPALLGTLGTFKDQKSLCCDKKLAKLAIIKTHKQKHLKLHFNQKNKVFIYTFVNTIYTHVMANNILLNYLGYILSAKAIYYTHV